MTRPRVPRKYPPWHDKYVSHRRGILQCNSIHLSSIPGALIKIGVEIGSIPKTAEEIWAIITGTGPLEEANSAG